MIKPNAILALGVVLVVPSLSLQAATECKGLDQAACGANAGCSWVSGYTRQDGKAVAAYCKSKGEKQAGGEAPAVPAKAPVAPVQAPAVPAKAPAAPVQVPAAPAKAPTAPVQAPATPAKAPAAPVQAPAAPAKAPAAPIQAPAAPAKAPTTPTPATPAPTKN